MSKVIVFKYTANGEVILNNPREYYEKVKAGTRVPISIYKDEKDLRTTQKFKIAYNDW